MKQFLRNNWGLIAMIFIVIGLFAYTQIYDLELRQKNVIVAREEQCYWWFNDANGNGMSTITDYCVSLKNACIASWHNLPCQWREETSFVNESGEEVAWSPRGCECNMW